MNLALTPQEIAQSVDTARFPAILTPDQAAELLQLAKTTLYRKVSEGSFREAVRRGKPLRFWRDRLLVAFLSGPSKWRPRQKSTDTIGNPPKAG
jgi:excisionase family DNA binding protein